jgi:hypothetical protein
MNITTIGQTLLLTTNVEVKILKVNIDLFEEPHYGVEFTTFQVGQPAKKGTGWIPVAILDEGSGFVHLT